MKLSEILKEKIEQEAAKKNLSPATKELYIKGYSDALDNDTPDVAVRFFQWIIKEANIQVPSVDAIEVHGLKDSKGLVPVMSAKEIYNYFEQHIYKP